MPYIFQARASRFSTKRGSVFRLALNGAEKPLQDDHVPFIGVIGFGIYTGTVADKNFLLQKGNFWSAISADGVYTTSA